jgi:single-strand DNA-binding protein
MNSTVITGNLVRDPELRSTASSTAVANFSVADNRRWADPATGERREATTYVDVVAWGDLGRHVAESLRQGDRVTVSGRLEQRSWQTDQGDRRSKLEVTAADVAASLRWVTLAFLRPEHGAELSQDQDYEHDLLEEGTAEAAHPEAEQIRSGRPPVHGKAVARGPAAQPAQQPASPPPGRAAAQATSDLGR